MRHGAGVITFAVRLADQRNLDFSYFLVHNENVYPTLETWEQAEWLFRFNEDQVLASAVTVGWEPTTKTLCVVERGASDMAFRILELDRFVSDVEAQDFYAMATAKRPLEAQTLIDLAMQRHLQKGHVIDLDDGPVLPDSIGRDGLFREF